MVYAASSRGVMQVPSRCACEGFVLGSSHFDKGLTRVFLLYIKDASLRISPLDSLIDMSQTAILLAFE